jgi:phosphoenolpyruvate---glycerone phosphotransferase subunit DhaL
MPSTHINGSALRELLLHAGNRIEAAEAQLNAYDSAIGDGDHGITMRLGFQAVRKRMGELPEDTTVGQVLNEAGKAFMRNTGGAIGVVLGRALMAAGAAVFGASELGPDEMRKLFTAMETAVAETGKAKPGDKTMLDPLHAVNLVLSGSPDDVPAMLSLAAGTADIAAKNTSGMICRLGRASRLGDRVLGHPDPGAMSFALIVAAFAERVRSLPQATPAVQR